MKETIIVPAVVIILFYCCCEKKIQKSTDTCDTTTLSRIDELKIKGPVKIPTLLENLVESEFESRVGKGFAICECGWSRKEVIDIISKMVPKLSSIYRNRLLINANLKGELLVRFSIWFKSGSVQCVSLASQKTNDSIFNKEVLNELKLVQFNSIDCQCDSLFVFNYPFVFGEQ